MRRLALTLFLSTLTLGSATAQMGPEVRLTDAEGWSWTSFSQTSSQRTMVTVGDTVHLVFMDAREDALCNCLINIYYKRSLDGGQTWGEDVALTEFTGNIFAFNPTIVTDGARLHVFWIDTRTWVGDFENELYTMSSDDGGETWTSDRRLTSLRQWSSNTNVTARGSDLHVFFQSDPQGGGSPQEIYYLKSEDRGTTWTTPRNLTRDNEDSMFPSAAFSGEDLHLVWSSATDSYPGEESYIRHSVSSDAGGTWSPSQRITSDPARSLAPSLAVTENALHVAWTDDRGGWQIFYQRSLDGGDTWEPERQMSVRPWSYFPYLEVVGNHVHMVYYSLVTGLYELHYTVSRNEGATWGADQMLIQQFPAVFFPSLAAGPGALHMVWSDGRHTEGLTNDEIYYRRIRLPEPSANHGLKR